MHIENHLLTSIEFIFSPNSDKRPELEDISLIVIHNISLPPNEFGANYIDQLFTNQLDPTAHPYFKEIAHLKVSAHLLINREGQCKQYVPFNQRAWHAGLSQYAGRERCNDFSIGIELEGSDDTCYTEPQYHCLAKVIGLLLAEYPKLSTEAIVGHSAIAPGRKTDPGRCFDWQHLQHLLVGR
jgi:AmpD protein